MPHCQFVELLKYVAFAIYIPETEKQQGNISPQQLFQGLLQERNTKIRNVCENSVGNGRFSSKLLNLIVVINLWNSFGYDNDLILNKC